jgi:hypothetical protein
MALPLILCGAISDTPGQYGARNTRDLVGERDNDHILVTTLHQALQP